MTFIISATQDKVKKRNDNSNNSSNTMTYNAFSTCLKRFSFFPKNIHLC